MMSFNGRLILVKQLQQVVFSWSTTDGAANANAPYTPPVGPGLWAPTPPAFAAAFGPYWGNDRLMVANSLDGAAPTRTPGLFGRSVFRFL